MKTVFATMKVAPELKVSVEVLCERMGRHSLGPYIMLLKVTCGWALFCL